jgi:hypothetical protein
MQHKKCIFPNLIKKPTPAIARVGFKELQKLLNLNFNGL